MAWHCGKIHEVAALGVVGFAMSTSIGATFKSRNWPTEGFPGT